MTKRASGSSLTSEVMLTRACLGFTLIASGFFVYDLRNAVEKVATWRHVMEGLAFLAIVAFLIYGNVVYQLTRLGYLKRLGLHRDVDQDTLESVYDKPAPSLLILVPSYKEELRTVYQTLMSAALQQYPTRRVTLLIDDPHQPADRESLQALSDVRKLVVDMDARLAQAAAPFVDALTEFLNRQAKDVLNQSNEAVTLSRLYSQAASWLEREADRVLITDHTDDFFLVTVLLGAAHAHRTRADHWHQRSRSKDIAAITPARLRREYERLAALFKVSLTSFERKGFVNLSHEPNKAMNLNTYMGLLGGQYKEVIRHNGRHLVRTNDADASLHIATANYLLTLDADSLLLPDYALRLLHLMETPGNERIAVAQTPYSAIPNAQKALERIAGATTDIQYIIHQGFTNHGATFWVGANAVLRRAALEEIAVIEYERGYPIKRYIQDRTVIEDTESTIELVDKGWTLFNYPQRLAYSATPPDFGALAVQRGRWANGGLIILPKLLRYLTSGPNRLHKLREGLFRVHYLTSIAGVNVGLVLLLAYPFPDNFQNVWLPLTALPYYALYGRDLWQSGYRRWLDLLQVYALNLILLPVNLGGVLVSLHQGIKGHKIPFRRTPKVAGRTQVAARYVAAEFAIVAACLGAALFNVSLGRWPYAVFAGLNGALFLYGIHVFMGFKASWFDLGFGQAEQPGPLLDLSLDSDSTSKP